MQHRSSGSTCNPEPPAPHHAQPEGGTQPDRLGEQHQADHRRHEDGERGQAASRAGCDRAHAPLCREAADHPGQCEREPRQQRRQVQRAARGEEGAARAHREQSRLGRSLQYAGVPPGAHGPEQRTSQWPASACAPYRQEGHGPLPPQRPARRGIALGPGLALRWPQLRQGGTGG